MQDDSFGISGILIGVSHCLTPTALSAGNTITPVSSLAATRQLWHAYSFDLPIAFDGTPGTSNGEGRASASTAVSDNLQSLVTTNANDCLFAGVLSSVAATLSGVTAGWNAASTPSVATDTSLTLFAFSQTVAATGTYNLSGTITSSNWVLCNVGYKYALPAAIVRPDFSRFPKTLMRR